jgi:2-methylisocitrate lyase-like PEP mutase family enzyme
MNQKQKAAAFHALHVRGRPVVLFNIWDAGTARAVAAAGAAALATGSWSVAAAHGWNDGEHVPLAFVLQNIERITAAVDLPLTVDLESGYGSAPAAVGETIAAAVAAGAIGCNLEDTEPATRSLRSAEEQSSRINRARQAADTAGIPFFLNARTDLFLIAPKEQHDVALADAALERARRYADAGADGFFVPGLVDAALIRRIAEGSPLPVNVMSAPGLPPLRVLQESGVARISHGPGPYRMLMQALTAAASKEYGPQD